MVHAATVPARTSGHDQRGDWRPVGLVVVVPVVDGGPDDDHRLAIGGLGVACELACQARDRVATDAGELLLPSGGVGTVVVVVHRVVAAKAPADPELGHEQVKHGRDGNRPVVGLDVADRHLTLVDPARCELVEGDHRNLVVLLDEGQVGVDWLVVQAVLHLDVPLAHFLLPAEADGALGHPQ